MTSDDDDDPEIGASNQGSSADDDGLPVGGRARPARRYLAIGELLDTLRPEFPDLTLSKIRFLEQQGLLEPERTPSGYRKFFSGQVERLWWILDQQRDGYIPLKEIRQRLAVAEASGILSALSVPPSAQTDAKASVHRLEPRAAAMVSPIPLNRQAPEPSHHDDAEDVDPDDVVDPSLRNAPKEALGESRHPSSVARRVQNAFAAMTGEGTTITTASGAAGAGGSRQPRPNQTVPQRGSPASPGGTTSATVVRGVEAQQGSPVTRGSAPGAAGLESGAVPSSPPPVPTNSGAQREQSARAGQAFGSANPLIGQYTGASFTFDELVRASGLEPEELRQLESFGILAGHVVLGATYYDEDALLGARAAHGFKQFGIEPRHMRIYRTMADRESGFLEQIVSPLVHRRQQAARTVAADQLEELISLGTQLRLVALRRLLRASLDGR